MKVARQTRLAGPGQPIHWELILTSRPQKRWRLSTISNITLLTLYLAGALALVVLVNVNARHQALHDAERYASLILDRNIVAHSFFNNVLKTSLYGLSEERFFTPEWLSANFAIDNAARDYDLFTHEDLYYKESAVNARNPVHEATPLEREFIERLNADPELKVESAIREYDGKPYFTVMRRGQVAKSECLHCHGEPDEAPAGIIAHYGSERGLAMQPGRTVSALSIRIPMAVAYQEANQFSFELSGFLLILLLVIFLLQYVVTRQLLFAPIDALYRKAQVIAHAPEQLGSALPLPRGLELSQLVEAFNTMSLNLREHTDLQEQIIQVRTIELEKANQALREDIEKRKQIEASLEQLRHRNEMILNTANEGILGLDAEGRITFFNQAASTLLELQPEHVGRINVQECFGRRNGDQTVVNAEERIDVILARGERVIKREGFLSSVGGRRGFPAEFSCAPIDGNGITGAVFSFSDISKRKHAELEIQNLAFYDQLTQLPNRTLFHDRITQRVAQAERDRDKLALMFLDLDDFKMVNDTLGHAAGDDFLRMVARRLQEGSRQADTVARLSGDEFVWFGEIADEEDASLIAQKFLEGVSRPVRLGEHNFNTTVSIGIAIFPDSARDVVSLMKCADTAMYAAKQKNKNAFEFYRAARKS